MNEWVSESVREKETDRYTKRRTETHTETESTLVCQCVCLPTYQAVNLLGKILFWWDLSLVRSPSPSQRFVVPSSHPQPALQKVNFYLVLPGEEVAGMPVVCVFRSFCWTKEEHKTNLRKRFNS